MPDKFIKTTGYKKQICSLPILNKPQTAETLFVVKDKAVKLKTP